MNNNNNNNKDGYKLIREITHIFGNNNNHDETISEILKKIKNLYNLKEVRIIEKTGKENFKITHTSRDINEEEVPAPDYSTAFVGDVSEDGYFIIDKDHTYNSATKKFIEKAKFTQCICVPVIYENSPESGFELIKYGEPLTKAEIESAVTVIKVLVSCIEASGDFLIQKKQYSKYDPVTGLIKHELFTQNLAKNLPQYTSTEPAAIVYTDMYEFKFINEKYSFDKGNTILKAIANILSSDKNIISASRMHSDNFIYIIKYSKDGPYKTVHDIKIIHQKLAEEIKKIISNFNPQFYSGIFIPSAKNISAETAITDAALAHKISKQSDTLNIVLFESSMMSAIRKREELNNKLDDAINRKNIVVYYQPKISCETEKLVGGEALVRWIRDDGSFIYPDEFIPAFEKSGNIIKLDYYVYKEVFAFLRRRIDAGLPVVPISVNVSRVHLRDDDITKYIKKLFDEYKLPPELLEFEITENIYMSDTEGAKKFMDFCKSMGVYISMDDFGSGFSSLNLVNTLPVDILKLDRQFVRNRELTESDKIVIDCVVSMAKKLKMKVICEGVETKNQSEFLKTIHCDMIQGYYYGKPMNEKSFEEYIANHI